MKLVLQPEFKAGMAKYIALIVAGGAFYGWARLMGGAMHVNETYIGLGISAVVFFWVWAKLGGGGN